MERPEFKNIKSFQEFEKYYWYRKELQQICKTLKIDHSGNKMDLNHNIKEYFKGNIIKPKQIKKLKSNIDKLTIDTKLLESGFCFNQKFRNFFIEQTGIKNFKFNADMVATVKKVKTEQDYSVTLGDLLDVYYGKKEIAKYDKSSCQWNKFFKDFCADERNSIYQNKLLVASIIWKEVRTSTRKKEYTKELVEEFYDKIKDYQ